MIFLQFQVEITIKYEIIDVFVIRDDYASHFK